MSQDKRTQAVLQSFRCTRVFNSQAVPGTRRLQSHQEDTRKQLQIRADQPVALWFLMVSGHRKKNLPRLTPTCSYQKMSKLWVSVNHCISGHLWLPRMSLAEVSTSRHRHVMAIDGMCQIDQIRSKRNETWNIMKHKKEIKGICCHKSHSACHRRQNAVPFCFQPKSHKDVELVINYTFPLTIEELNSCINALPMISLSWVKGDNYATNSTNLCCLLFLSFVHFILSTYLLHAVHQFLGSPCSPVKEYTHRIGRTGRAGKKGGAMLQGQPAVFDKIFPWEVNMLKLNRWNLHDFSWVSHVRWQALPFAFSAPTPKEHRMRRFAPLRSGFVDLTGIGSSWVVHARHMLAIFVPSSAKPTKKSPRT